MTKVTCISESVYSNALTRGKVYEVLARDASKRQYRLRGDDHRVRWFPICCFRAGSKDVPLLKEAHCEDAAANIDPSVGVEVTVELTDGTRRWCVFMTPEALTQCGDWIDGTQIRFHYGNANLVIAARLDHDLIARMLRQIDAQGHLIDCTLPLEAM